MSITASEMTPADIAAVTNGGNGGFGGFGGDSGAWWLLVLLFAMNGGWFGGGYGNRQGAGSAGGDALYPWLNQAQNGWEGVSTLQNSLANGFANVNQALCNGFAGVQNGFAQAEIAANGRQMADMNQAFAAQTAMAQGFNALGSQFANCCCENRLGLANLNSTVIAENCADREALNSIGRDIIASQTAGTQRILDQMCQDKIDAKNDTIAQLRAELMYARGQASQDVQTAAIQAGQRVLANEIEQYVAPKATPAYIVQNPNCCPQTFGCGCGA